MGCVQSKEKDTPSFKGVSTELPPATTAPNVVCTSAGAQPVACLKGQPAVTPQEASTRTPAAAGKAQADVKKPEVDGIVEGGAEHDNQGCVTQEGVADDADVALCPTNIEAVGLKHIGFGPLKKENQDEYYVQITDFAGQPNSSLFCVFDGHGTYGKDAATFCRQELPLLLDEELSELFAVGDGKTADSELAGAVELIICEVFMETEKRLQQSGVNVQSSGTTATVVYQLRNKLWVASAGDSRVILCSSVGGCWKERPLTIDHRPARRSERARVEAAGGRVEPKRLPSGKLVGEPRLWLQHIPTPGLLLSRSIGDDMATSVGCTAQPEVTHTSLRPGDTYLVLGSDGVWDVLTNQQVCDIACSCPTPEAACQKVLEASLLEWEERLAADNVTVLVVKYMWGEDNAPVQAAVSGAPATT